MPGSPVCFLPEFSASGGDSAGSRINGQGQGHASHQLDGGVRLYQRAHTLVSEREANCFFPLEETFPGEKCPPEVESSPATLSQHRLLCGRCVSGVVLDIKASAHFVTPEVPSTPEKDKGDFK